MYKIDEKTKKTMKWFQHLLNVFLLPFNQDKDELREKL